MDDDDALDVEEDGHGHRFSTHEHHGHYHGQGQAAGWGDCCGIPIPSVFAAAEQKQAQDRIPVRRIPFD